MKSWQFHLLCMMLGSGVMYVANLIMPVFVFFVLYGKYIAWFTAIYILGRCVLILGKTLDK